MMPLPLLHVRTIKYLAPGYEPGRGHVVHSHSERSVYA